MNGKHLVYKAEYAVGDKVLIRDNLLRLDVPNSPGITSGMTNLEGSVCTVHDFHFNDQKRMFIYLMKENHWNWIGEWLRPVDVKMFNDIDETILMDLF